MADAWRRKIGTRARWTEEDGRAALAAWEASGESLPSFARRAGVQAQRLSWWRDRLAAVASSSTLVPVTVTGSVMSSAVVTIGAVRVEVGDLEQLSPAWIAALASALGEVGS